jgi:hypothetical protein
MALAVGIRPAAIGGALVNAIRSVDAEQPVYDARTLEAVVDRSVAQRWLQTVLLGSFAVIAVLLASIGVYGVIAYTVGQRRRAFGIRLALGARRSALVGDAPWRAFLCLRRHQPGHGCQRRVWRVCCSTSAASI